MKKPIKIKPETVSFSFRGAEIFCGDCFNVINSFPDKFRNVDCLVTDPPYGLTACEWDKPIDLPQFWRLTESATKRNANMIVFSCQPFTTRLISSNYSEFRYEIIWEKSNALGFLNCKIAPLKAHENIVVFYRKGCSAKSKDNNKRTAYNPQKTPAKKRVRVEYQKSIELYHKFNAERNYIADSTYPRSVIMVQDDIYRHDSTKRETLRHPTRKPEKLLEYLVNTYSNENEIVFDPFTGSGTTAVACIRHNRRFIGIEKERKYFDMTIERIKAAYKELDSFFPEVLQHEQKKIYFNE